MKNTNEHKTPKNKVQCTVTGLWFGMTTNVRKKRIEKAGSEEAFRAGYVCREAKALLKDGKTIDEIKAMVSAGTLHSEAAEPKFKMAAAKAPKTKKTPKAKAEPAAPIVESIKQDETVDEDIANFLSLT